MKKTRILWVSRHPPLKSQIMELASKLGDIEIMEMREAPNAEYVARKAEEIGADIIIPVLPLSIIARLVPLAKEKKKTILWAEMEQVDAMRNSDITIHDPDHETIVPAKNEHGEPILKVMRFKRFHKIKAVKLDLEPF